MNLDFNSTQSTRYLQVYDYYKNLITTGRLLAQLVLALWFPVGQHASILAERTLDIAPPQIKVETVRVHVVGGEIVQDLCLERRTVCFRDTRFAQGMVIFEDYGFDVEKEKENANVLYMTPSHMTSLVWITFLPCWCTGV